MMYEYLVILIIDLYANRHKQTAHVMTLVGKKSIHKVQGRILAIMGGGSSLYKQGRSPWSRDEVASGG